MTLINDIRVERSSEFDGRYVFISHDGSEEEPVWATPTEARAVAAELIRLADEIDAKKEPQT